VNERDKIVETTGTDCQHMPMGDLTALQHVAGQLAKYGAVYKRQGDWEWVTVPDQQDTEDVVEVEYAGDTCPDMRFAVYLRQRDDQETLVHETRLAYVDDHYLAACLAEAAVESEDKL